MQHTRRARVPCHPGQPRQPKQRRSDDSKYDGNIPSRAQQRASEHHVPRKRTRRAFRVPRRELELAPAQLAASFVGKSKPLYQTVLVRVLDGARTGAGSKQGATWLRGAAAHAANNFRLLLALMPRRGGACILHHAVSIDSTHPKLCLVPMAVPRAWAKVQWTLCDAGDFPARAPLSPSAPQPLSPSGQSAASAFASFRQHTFLCCHGQVCRLGGAGRPQ